MSFNNGYDEMRTLAQYRMAEIRKECETPAATIGDTVREMVGLVLSALLAR